MYEIDMAIIYDSIIRLNNISSGDIKNWISNCPEDVAGNLVIASIFNDISSIDLRNANEDTKIDTYIDSLMDNIYSTVENTLSDDEKKFITKVFKYYLEGMPKREDVDRISILESMVSNRPNSEDECVQYFEFHIMYELLRNYNYTPAVYNKKALPLATTLKEASDKYSNTYQKISRKK